MEFFVAVVIVLVVLIYFMVIVLRSVVSEVNQKVNGYFLKHLEDFDEQYEDKFTRIKEMNEKEEKLSSIVRRCGNVICSLTSSYGVFTFGRSLPD